MSSEEYLLACKKLVKTAGEHALSSQSQFVNYQIKERKDIVTSVDMECEKIILDYLSERYPHHSIKSEESSPNTEQDEWQWVIDPIDGTVNFANGLPYYSTSVALLHNGIPRAGAIYCPALKMLFTSEENKGAFLNGKPISCSNKRKLEECVFSFMMTSHYSKDETSEIISLVNKLSGKVRGLRLIVSQALELGYIASGSLDGTFCIKSRGFSSAAGTLLVKESGCLLLDKSLSPHSSSSRSLFSCNKYVLDELRELFQGD